MRKRSFFLAIPVFFAAVLVAQQVENIAKLSATAEIAAKAWREGDTKLEAEISVVPKSQIDPRIQQAAADAEKATLAKHAVADAESQLAKRSLEWLEKETAGQSTDFQIAALKSQDVQLAGDSALLDRNIKAFAEDRDPGIQRVKVVMDRERSALQGVRDAIAAEQKLLAAIKAASGQGDTALAPAAALFTELAAGANQDRARLEKEGTLWQTYYQALPQAAEARSSKTAIAPGDPQAGTTQTTVVLHGGPTPLSAKLRVESPGGSDSSRWTGSWTYPVVNGMFTGDEPESVEVIVREEGGQLIGLLSARFKIPKGVPRDPVLRLDFHGPLTGARTQKLSVATADGTKGTLELLPGSAANLLEVTWHLDEGPASLRVKKVRLGGLILVKK